MEARNIKLAFLFLRFLFYEGWGGKDKAKLINLVELLLELLVSIHRETSRRYRNATILFYRLLKIVPDDFCDVIKNLHRRYLTFCFFFAVEYVFKRHIPPWRHRVQTRRYLRCHSLGLRKL